MNKNTITILKVVGIIALIILIGAMVYFFGRNKEEKVDKTKTLEDIKKIIGMDLTLMSQVIKWNTSKGESALDGKGYYYLDLLKAPKLMQISGDLDKFFKDNEFKNDSRNKEVNSDEKTLIRYKKSNIVCNLSRIDNSDGGSSLSIGCADINEKICDFNSNCGRECKVDSDCGIRLDSCQKKTLCRNKNYKFYSECSNSSTLIKDVDLTIQKCQCKKNQCEPYFPYLQPTPTP